MRRTAVQDWQVHQARRAVEAWFAWRDRQASPATPPVPQIGLADDGSADAGAILAAVEQMARVRPYSRRTERTGRGSGWFRAPG